MSPPPPPAPFWQDERLRAVALQLLVLGAVAGLVWWFADNAATALAARNIASGFGFLSATAGFEIGFHLIPYERTSTHFDVLLVGLTNTLLVAVIGIVLATLLGFAAGVARLSPNWLIARIAAFYVETVRNVPLLLQIVFFYFLLINPLPPVRDSLQLAGGIIVNQRGVFFPAPVFEDGSIWIAFALLAGLAGALALRIAARRHQAATGKRFADGWAGLGLILGLPVLAWLAAGQPIAFDSPRPGNFNITGGIAVPPELFALLAALVLYTGAFIAEIVRAGIEAVAKGQTEAAAALGLNRAQRLRLVTIPQAMRVIVPPLTSQYLNLTKNSSLAGMIAYPDLVKVFTGTSLNQTGQAIEIIAITMLIFLSLSLFTALVMNIYNARVQLRER